ncbi:hypothetical protein OZ411_24700 [Bradyrhizobium sp. Arg237L]|uniref:hypothetical protein n=1 Tax=Bradyrhizobium sp. Arg237L TaxID=3003352 RepID=UPI00249DE1AE|nr:hypothetical protein [Bradyrhizobium sp. Arg237L]MDI4236015.1 hypothetical protein [Bradyrhizobium sp. Arg237L]
MQLKLFITAAMAVFFDISIALLAAAAQSDAPKPPHVEFITVPAGQLHLGMTEQEVIRIMGEPARVVGYDAGGISRRKLEFFGAIPSTVTLSDGKVSHVKLDVFQVEKSDLPLISRKAWPGMASTAVRRSFGEPSRICHYTFFGIKLDQWVYDILGEPEVSVFFAADRVIAKTLGRHIPQDIFQVRLPAVPQPRDSFEGPRAGMAIADVQALYGETKLHVDYVFNSQPASRVIVEIRAKGSFAAFTFVDDRLVEFEDLGRLPDEVFQAG